MHVSTGCYGVYNTHHSKTGKQAMTSTNAAHAAAGTATTGPSAIRRQPIEITIEPVLVDVTTACELLGGISRRTLDALVRDGHLTPKTVGTRVLFLPDELRRFAATCPDWEPRT